VVGKNSRGARIDDSSGRVPRSQLVLSQCALRIEETTIAPPFTLLNCKIDLAIERKRERANVKSSREQHSPSREKENHRIFQATINFHLYSSLKVALGAGNDKSFAVLPKQRLWGHQRMLSSSQRHIKGKEFAPSEASQYISPTSHPGYHQTNNLKICPKYHLFFPPVSYTYVSRITD
jgi:hypothetical protein